jgi:DNA adenine methylase
MVLNRIGRKSHLAKKIITHFPVHKKYIELFFGAGGLFFNKPKVRGNFLNDLDEEVWNFWKVFRDQKDRLIKLYEIIPFHEGIFKEYKATEEEDDIMKALRFMYLCNFSLMNKGMTMRYKSFGTTRGVAIKMAENTLQSLSDVSFFCCDFRDVFGKISFDHKNKKKDLAETFIYSDPPYLEKENNYKTPKWTKDDYIDLLDSHISYNVKFAISESNTAFVVEQAEQRELFITPIHHRKTMGGKYAEILITNYPTNQLKLF